MAPVVGAGEDMQGSKSHYPGISVLSSPHASASMRNAELYM